MLGEYKFKHLMIHIFLKMIGSIEIKYIQMTFLTIDLYDLNWMISSNTIQ